MSKRMKAAIAAAGVAVIAGAGIGIGVASAGGDSEDPITGPALERASSAALEHVGEGRVTDTEVGDEEGFYEVEVTLDNGSEVDVHLDEDFNVLGADAPESDSEEDEDNDGDNE